MLQYLQNGPGPQLNPSPTLGIQPQGGRERNKGTTRAGHCALKTSALWAVSMLDTRFDMHLI